MRAAPTAVLLLSIILVIVNATVAVSIPKRIKDAMTLTRSKKPPPSIPVSTSGMYDIDAFMHEHCENGYVGTLSGSIGSGQHDLDQEGHCLMFMTPFPIECALNVEMITGQVRRYRQNYDEGGMLEGHFKSLSVEC